MNAPHDAEPLPDDWEQRDAVGSYYVGCDEIGKRVRAGEPLPWWFRSMRETEPAE